MTDNRPATQTRRTAKGSGFNRIMRYLIVFGAAIVIGFPAYWMFITAITPRGQLYVWPPSLFPDGVSFDIFVEVFHNTQVVRWLFNTAIVATVTAIGSIAIASLSGYALSRFRHLPGVTFATIGILVTQMLPQTIIVIPLYIIFMDMGLLQRPFTMMILVSTTFALPFCTLMLKGFFDTLPRELEEAAVIDGCSPLGALFSIIFPLIKPGVIVTGVFSFILAWDEFLFARTLIVREVDWLISVGLSSLYGQYSVYYDQVAAIGILATAPPLVIFLFAQRQIVEGLSAGGLKE